MGSTILYFPASVLPLDMNFGGCWMVIVLEKAISWAPASGAAQLPQKRVSAGFSN
jgi:hypothetical protein